MLAQIFVKFEVETPTEGITEEKARELMAQNRQHSEHLHESMLSRSSQEVEAPIALRTLTNSFLHKT